MLIESNNSIWEMSIFTSLFRYLKLDIVLAVPASNDLPFQHASQSYTSEYHVYRRRNLTPKVNPRNERVRY